MVFATLVALLLPPVALGQGGAGAVRGSVYDSDWDVPVEGVTVTVIGAGLAGRTNEDGLFLIEGVSPGSYTVSFSAPGFERKIISDVIVTSGKLADLQVELRADYVEMETLVVTGTDLLGDSEVGLLDIRQTSVAQIDAISTELISKAGKSDVAEALKLVVGTTVVDGKYATVRGLSDRYTGTTLNGIRLPSADPRKRAVQVDLFPTGTVEAISVTKTFTPDLQGDFTGGGVDIRTKSIPESLTLSFSASYGTNSLATGNDRFLTYKGGGVEPLESMPERALPAETDNDLPSFPLATIPPTSQRVEDALAFDTYSKSFTPVIGTSRGTADNNTGFRLLAGDRFQAGPTVIGVLGGMTYSRKYDFYENGQNNTVVRRGPEAELDIERDRVDDRGTEEYLVGGLATVVVQPVQGHEVAVRYIINEGAQDEARFQNQVNSPSEIEQNQTLHYTERRVRSWQLAGNHYLRGLFGEGGTFSDMTIDWVTSDNNTRQYEPDVRFFRNLWNPKTYVSGPPRNSTNALNTRRTFRDIEEFAKQYAANVQVPFRQWGGLEGRLKVGLYRETSDRLRVEDAFTYGFTFQFGRNEEVTANNRKAGYTGQDEDDLWTDVFLDPDRVGLAPVRCPGRCLRGENRGEACFADSDCGEGGACGSYGNPFLPGQNCARAQQLLWTIQPINNDVYYRGDQDISAWYWMAEIPLTQGLTLTGGTRQESTLLEVVPYNPDTGLIDQIILADDGLTRLVDNATPQDEGRASIDESDVLPSVSLAWQIVPSMKLRATWAKTIARPTFRELAPVATEEFIAGDEFFGNNKLVLSRIDNYDLRWEWFRRPGDVLALSLFHKDITDPIELLSFLASNRSFIQPVNFESGQVRGYELEARTTLDRVRRLGKNYEPGRGALSQFTLGFNYTYIDSSVEVPEEEFASLEDFGLEERERRLQGQPAYAGNVFLTWDSPALGMNVGVFYNQVGETLVTGAARGFDGTPNVFQLPFGTLDATVRKRFFKRLSVGFRARNLLQPEAERVYRTPDGLEEVQSKRETPKRFDVSFSWSW